MSSAAVTEGWIGEGRTPAVLHLPAPHRGVGVVISAPFGQDQILAYRAQRLLAQELADAGFAVVRHDHPGFGDSVTEQSADTLLAGAADAASALRAAGCTGIVYVGLSSGSLVASAAAAADRAAGSRVAGLALWDPATSGKQWLRRARSLYTVSLGDEAEPHESDDIVVVGAEFTPSVASAIGALTLDAALAEAVPTAVFTRSEATAELPTALRSAATSIDVVRVDGHREMLDGSSISAAIPAGSVTAVREWIVGRFARGAALFHAPSHLASLSTTVAVLDSPAPLVEEAVRLGRHALFAIETRPAVVADDAPAVILHNGSSENRTGVSRHQVVLARRLAAQGTRVIRVDRRGEGETGVVHGDEPNLLFAEEWIEDGADVVDALDLPAERVVAAGVCVGSWLALLSAPGRVRSVVAISPNDYRVLPAPHDAVANLERAATAEPEPQDPATGTETTPARLPLRRRLPHPVLLALSKRGHGQVVEGLLRPAVSAGVDVALVMGPRDQGVFAERNGAVSLRRLAGADGRIDTVRVESGDHGLFSPGIRGRIMDEVERHVEKAFGSILGSDSAPASAPASLAASGFGSGSASASARASVPE